MNPPAHVPVATLKQLLDELEHDREVLGIVAWHVQLAPAGDKNVVFRDSAFADDVAKTNLSAILQQHGLAKVTSM